MVPANDEHKSTNATGENTSTHKNFFEKLKFWKRRDEDEHEPARLTAMPDCLMHWWTPVLFALILLAAGCFLASIWRMPLRPLSWEKINPLWPPSWPFNYHWPSKDAMALCATIAGAGFAFSAWQQRSHDNVVKEKQAQATVEREDYWKRREHIFQLLGSKNPGLRLGAVALLAELADSVARSTLLNDTEKQQLQHHIIDTLKALREHYGPDDALILVLGSDQFRNLDTWHDWQHLLDYAHLAVTQRERVPLSDLPPDIEKLLAARGTGSPPDTPAGSIMFFRMPPVPLSATQLQIEF